MAGAGGNGLAITTWGKRDGKQVWRVRWNERPGMHADVTGPWETMDALVKLTPEVLARLPWRED